MARATGVDRRSDRVVDQGAHRASPAVGRGADPASLPRAEARGGRRPERSAGEHASGRAGRPRGPGDRPPRPEHVAAAGGAARDPLRLRRRARDRVLRRREPLAENEPRPGRTGRAHDLRGQPRLCLPALGSSGRPGGWRRRRSRGSWPCTSCSAPRWRACGARSAADDD